MKPATPAETVQQDKDAHSLWLGAGLLLMAFIGWQYHSTRAAKAEARMAVLAECAAEESCVMAVSDYFDPCFDANYTAGLSVVLNNGGMLECLSENGVQIATREQ